MPHPPAQRLRPPKPSHRVGVGGNLVSPYPCSRAAPAQTLPRAGEWGNPVAPFPYLRAAPAQTLLRAGGWGNQVPPWSRETVMRMAHNAAMTMTWERGRDARATAPRARRRPPPGPSPTGGGNPAPPPSGGRLGGGLNPANDGHLSSSAAQRRDENVVPGRAAPSQTLPRVGAWGNPVAPCPCGAGAWGNPVAPHPSSRAYVHVKREQLPGRAA